MMSAGTFVGVSLSFFHIFDATSEIAFGIPNMRLWKKIADDWKSVDSWRPLLASESKIKKWKRKNNPERVCLELLWSVICLSTAYIFLHYYWNSFSFVSKPLQRYSSSFGIWYPLRACRRYPFPFLSRCIKRLETNQEIQETKNASTAGIKGSSPLMVPHVWFLFIVKTSLVPFRR